MILDRLQKARLEVNNLKNTAARALYAIDKAIEEAEIEPDPTPTPTPTPPQNPDPEPDPVPDPEPDPVPEPPPVGDGEISTTTGTWKVEKLAGGYKVGGEHFVWREPTDTGVITDAPTPLAGIPFTCLEGGMKFAGTDIATPEPERLLAAVKSGRVLPYSQKAFTGWPKTPAFAPDKRPNGGNLTYRPDRIYGRSSSSNGVGIVDGQGSEQPSSRGFISGDDAQAIAAVVDGNAKAFADLIPVLRSGLLYGLSLPNFAIWSGKNDCLRDPQIGDETYFNEGQGKPNYGNDGKWTCPVDYPYADEINAVPGTTYSHGDRNEAHLFNHGYAWWLATGDWRAALLLQTTAAYMLASNYLRTPGAYNPRFAYQRSTVNQFNALWVLRDVSLHASGSLLWNRAKTDLIINDMWVGWERKLAAMDAASDVYSRSSTAIRGIDLNGDNAYNTYQIHTYGLESAYLWARAGRPALLRRLAEHLIIRFGMIGGTRGYYGHGSGSGFAVLVNGEMPYDGTAAGLVKWSQTATQWPADSFDGAPAHYVLRAWWGLKMAAEAVPDANVEGVTAEQALAVMDAARAKTVKFKDVGVIGWKHAGIPHV